MVSIMNPAETRKVIASNESNVNSSQQKNIIVAFKEYDDGTYGVNVIVDASESFNGYFKVYQEAKNVFYSQQKRMFKKIIKHID